MIEELEQLKALLWERWDPIGVNETDCPRDEYAAYATRIFSMLQDGAGREQITEYLSWAQTENMGMTWSDIHGPIADQAANIQGEAHK